MVIRREPPVVSTRAGRSAVKVVIPWRPAPSRLEAFDRVVGWYQENLRGVAVETIDTDDVPFVLAACRNAAMRDAPPDTVVVIGDADTIPERAPLLAAIRAAATSGVVHLPYDEYRWLGPAGTAEFLAGADLDTCAVEQYVHTACSGIYVATPRNWARHGGQDEGFQGWGFEDAAWNLAHRTLLGAPPRRHRGRVYALHHDSAPREGLRYAANAARMERYRSAVGDHVAMAALVAESVSRGEAPFGARDTIEADAAATGGTVS